MKRKKLENVFENGIKQNDIIEEIKKEDEEKKEENYGMIQEVKNDNLEVKENKEEIVLKSNNKK